MAFCKACGHSKTNGTWGSSSYSLRRNPRSTFVCTDCTRAAAAQNATSALREQMSQVFTLDAGLAQCGVSVEERNAQFLASGYADAFNLLIANE